MNRSLLGYLIILGFLLISSLSAPVFSQGLNPKGKPTFFQRADSLNKSRRNAVYITEATLATAALIGLNELWYADYPRSSFKFTKDSDQWMQMDKFGHTFSSYYIGKMGMDALAWAGESKKNQLIYGATLGFAFLTAVEIMDGFSEQWGFSVGDMAANAVGTGLLIGQELLWEEQRIQMKFSFSRSPYAGLFPEQLGSSTLEQLLKDYNGQTYWASVNLYSFFKDSKVPKWLNISFGYGANGLPVGSLDESFDPPQPIESYRQLYASVDVDLTRIQTRSDFLRTLFNIFNFVKIPAPALEYRTNGSFRFHWIHF